MSQLCRDLLRSCSEHFNELIDNPVILVFIRCCDNDPFMLFRPHLWAAAKHHIPGRADRVVIQYPVRFDRRYQEWANLRFQRGRGGGRFRRRFAARDAGGLRRFSGACVRWRFKPLACLNERESSVHPSGLPAHTPSDRIELAQRRRSVSSSISIRQPHRDSEGDSRCWLGYGIVPY